MDLYAHATLQLWQEHPRDILWFDLYADQRVRNAAISAAAKSSDEHHCSLNLMLESTFTSSSGCKQPPLSEDRMERQIIDGLRQEASITATTPLKQALRCLATCLDNYARYGSEDAVCRVIALAEALNAGRAVCNHRRENHSLLIQPFKGYASSYASFANLFAKCSARSV